ncbi:MAG: hybrid sensor histidine kinase/response regulator [Alphaproteobacteria bacterium]|nr:hybrid sensor histidine kinase/response regulator [Alphaproteobacteria bacterium]
MSDLITILLIEDSEELRDVVQLILTTKYNYKVHVADNGQEALKLLDKLDYQVDLILLDYMMPEINGIDLFRLLLKSPGKDLPVVMITSSDALELVIEFMKLGGADFVQKPVIDYGILDLIIQRAIAFSEKNKKLLKAEAALIAAESAREFMENFIAKISHELGTPSHHISSALTLIKKAHVENDNQKLEEWIATAEISNQRLKRLVKDIFDITAIQKGRFSIYQNKANLRTLIKTAVSEVKTQPNAFTGKFETDNQDIILNCDQDRVTQVLVNLLNNSVRYAPDSEKIDIKLKKEDQSVICSVSDLGPGISKGDRENIFKPFFQNEEGYNHSGTLGLGLTISREIIRQHGGTLSVESNSPKGTTFIFTLPLSQGETHAQLTEEGK